MFVLGIDPGLSVTGYGVVTEEGGRGSVAAAGVIRTDSEAAVPMRLLELHSDVKALISEHRPVSMAVERLFVNRNLQTASSVAKAVGVIMLAAAEHRVPVFEYTPSQVKTAVAGYGDATKDQVVKMVVKRLRLTETPAPADTADALAAALCHLQVSGFRQAVERAT